MATEIALLSLKPGLDVTNQSSNASAVLRDTIKTATEQPGFQRLRWGVQVEDPSTVVLFIDWDKTDDHQRFIDSPAYTPFATHLNTILSTPPDLVHVHFNPHHPNPALSPNTSPTTEVLFLHIPASSSHDAAAAFTRFVDGVGPAASKAPHGFRGAAGGWQVEEGTSAKITDEGGRSRVFVGALGWDSVEAHLGFRGTEAFGENIHFLRDGAVEARVWHVNLEEAVA